MFLLTITPEEARLLEFNLHHLDSGLLDTHRWIIRKIAQSLVNQVNVDLPLEPSQLWFLRDSIDPKSAVSTRCTGMTLIIRLYTLLLKTYDTPAKYQYLPEAPLEVLVETTNDNTNTSQSAAATSD